MIITLFVLVAGKVSSWRSEKVLSPLLKLFTKYSPHMPLSNELSPSKSQIKDSLMGTTLFKF